MNTSKIVYSLNSFLRYCQFLCPETGVATPIFDNTRPNIFQSTFSLHESVSTYKKSGIFIILFYRYGQFKNPGI